MPNTPRETEANVPLIQQPDPMLREGRAHPLKIAGVLGGAALVVVLVLYGLTRPEREQVATAPTEAPAAQAQSTATPAPANSTKAAPSTTTGQATPQDSRSNPGSATR